MSSTTQTTSVLLGFMLAICLVFMTGVVVKRTGGGGSGTGSVSKVTICKFVDSPQSSDTSMELIWEAPAACTIDRVSCETDTGTAGMDIQIDDGTPADVMGTDLDCDSDGESDEVSLTGTMAEDDSIDIVLGTVATDPTRLSLCFRCAF